MAGRARLHAGTLTARTFTPRPARHVHPTANVVGPTSATKALVVRRTVRGRNVAVMAVAVTVANVALVRLATAGRVRPAEAADRSVALGTHVVPTTPVTEAHACSHAPTPVRPAIGVVRGLTNTKLVLTTTAMAARSGVGRRAVVATRFVLGRAPATIVAETASPVAQATNVRVSFNALVAPVEPLPILATASTVAIARNALVATASRMVRRTVSRAMVAMVSATRAHAPIVVVAGSPVAPATRVTEPWTAAAEHAMRLPIFVMA